MNVELDVVPGDLITFKTGITVVDGFVRLRLPSRSVCLVTSFEHVPLPRKRRDDAFLSLPRVTAKFAFVWRDRALRAFVVKSSELWVSSDPAYDSRKTSTKNFAFWAPGERP